MNNNDGICTEGTDRKEIDTLTESRELDDALFKICICSARPGLFMRVAKSPLASNRLRIFGPSDVLDQSRLWWLSEQFCWVQYRNDVAMIVLSIKLRSTSVL